MAAAKKTTKDAGEKKAKGGTAAKGGKKQDVGDQGTKGTGSAGRSAKKK